MHQQESTRQANASQASSFAWNDALVKCEWAKIATSYSEFFGSGTEIETVLGYSSGYCKTRDEFNGMLGGEEFHCSLIGYYDGLQLTRVVAEHEGQTECEELADLFNSALKMS